MSLEYQNVTHSYGKNTVLRSLSLTAKAGEITCLFGASGSGKSTLLRLAAGLEPLQEGSISVEGEVMAMPGKEPPPEARPVGLMFQENALFPHMNVAQNIAFGLGRSAVKKEALVGELLQSVGLPGFEKRYPHTLSGGQQQRIALARSLAPKPKILLMDEPYASIDSTLRRTLREAARQTLKQNKTTTILVTHDPAEAMEMADVIAVLDAGNIVQFAPPQTLYGRPEKAEVAALFGDAQVVEADALDGGYMCAYGLIVPARGLQDHRGHCKLVVRPTGLEIKKDKASELKVVDLRFNGNGHLAYLAPKDPPPSLSPLRVLIDDAMVLDVGDKVSVRARDKDFFIF